MYRTSPCLKYISSVFSLVSADGSINEADEVICKIRDLIYSSSLNKTVTLVHPSTVGLPGPVIDTVSNTSFLVKGVRLSTLCDLRFLSTWIIPKRLIVYNVTGRHPVNTNFFIDVSSVLHLKLDSEAYKTLGLSNCTETHKNNDDTIVLKIDLKELSGFSGPTKRYKKIQKSLSHVSPATVIISTERLDEINKDDIMAALKNIGDDVTVEVLVATTKHIKIPQKIKHQSLGNLNFYSLLSDSWKVVGDTDTGHSGFKRRKISYSEKDLHPSKPNLEKFVEHKNSIEKIYNTLEKNKDGRGSLIGDLIHELDQKNLHEKSNQDGSLNHPISQLVKFIDMVNLWTKNDPLENLETETKDSLNFYKIDNGIISSEYIFCLFKNAWFAIESLFITI
ncbi:conserved hypothetical protein [Theileria equi strain WA]|uniref:Uncharacterized protein n=1 Tax=Theileria equi strain WA TaxID=1537102 RepID=L1LFV1_THEEQ|nr:conserved hypothetical protein [Theileria equi strain WA]EKX74231.1 conserved hypothetical protein [Theileria equi strain WA]|eukprot:XP_004833683.1 conserved hypothetical protein [Theileria equi strain WA]